jgi:hypothetical protein
MFSIAMGFTPKLLHNGGTISDVSRPLLAPLLAPKQTSKSAIAVADALDPLKQRMLLVVG